MCEGGSTRVLFVHPTLTNVLPLYSGFPDHFLSTSSGPGGSDQKRTDPTSTPILPVRGPLGVTGLPDERQGEERDVSWSYTDSPLERGVVYRPNKLTTDDRGSTSTNNLDHSSARHTKRRGTDPS